MTKDLKGETDKRTTRGEFNLKWGESDDTVFLYIDITNEITILCKGRNYR